MDLNRFNIVFHLVMVMAFFMALLNNHFYVCAGIIGALFGGLSYWAVYNDKGD